jgi:hypothetical protein
MGAAFLFLIFFARWASRWSKLAASPNHDKGDHVMAKVSVIMLKPSVKRVWPNRNFPHTNSPSRNES